MGLEIEARHHDMECYHPKQRPNYDGKCLLAHLKDGEHAQALTLTFV